MFLTIQIQKFSWQVPNRAATAKERAMIQDVIDFIEIGNGLLKNLRKSPDQFEQATWEEAVLLIGQLVNDCPGYGHEIWDVMDQIVDAFTFLRRRFPFKSPYVFADWCCVLENHIRLSHCFLIVLKMLKDDDDLFFA